MALGVAVWASLEVAVLTLHALARGNKLLPFKKKCYFKFLDQIINYFKISFQFFSSKFISFLFLILISNSCGPSQNLRMLAFKQGTPHIKY